MNKRGYSALPVGEVPIFIGFIDMLKRKIIGSVTSLMLMMLYSAGARATIIKPTWQTLAQSTYITEGDRGPIIYDFVDPSCPYCHALYENWQPFIKQGKVTVRFILVAFIEPSSAPKAAAILQSKNTQQALAHYEQNFKDISKSLSRTVITHSSKVNLNGNLELFHQLGGQVVPFTVYRNRSGVLKRISGEMTPSDIALLLQNMENMR